MSDHLTAPPATAPESPDPLHLALAHLEGRVTALTAARRETDPQPDDPFLGLYITEERLGSLLRRHASWHERSSGGRPSVGARTATAPASPLELAPTMGLDATDAALLVTAAAPDLDPRFERFYGYLNDDVTLKRATVGLALELCGLDPFDAHERARLLSASHSVLLRTGLIEIEEAHRPMMTRSLRVPDRVIQQLLGSARIDDVLQPVLRDPASVEHPLVDQLAAGLREQSALTYVDETDAAVARELASAAVGRAGRAALVIDLEGIASDEHIALGVAAARECALGDRVLVVGPVAAETSSDRAAIRQWANAADRVILHGAGPWDPSWTFEAPVQYEVAPYGPTQRREWWEQLLAGSSVDPAHLPSLAALRLSATGAQRAAADGAERARLRGETMNIDDLHVGIRQQNAARLRSLATCVRPQVSWEHLVVTPDVERALHGLASRVRHRDQVLGEWGMRPGGNRGHGITALFAGDSGTGKTMSAEVIASDLGIDLYVINVATLVDKYIGETEKNLDRVLSDAVGVNGVLLFDEADAIFGQRSEVRDSHDRYANLEVAYLLQRIEQFDGLAILSTNLRSNLDDAFTRRLDVIVDFAVPDPPERRVLWEGSLAPVPTTDLDLDFCARSFRLSGGNIRSIAITAGYRAAACGDPVDMRCLIECIGEEYRKLGRLCLRDEFGPYLDLLTDEPGAEVAP